VFTGDFRHAGVNNICNGSDASNLMEYFSQRMGVIEVSKRKTTQLSEKLKMLCDFPGLRQLCRLHCATQGKPGCGKVIIPSNSVGFYQCLENPPNNASPTTCVSEKINTYPAIVGHGVQDDLPVEDTGKPSYKRPRGDGASDNDGSKDTVKVLKSTHILGVSHTINCPACHEEIKVASHITLPYWRSLRSANADSSQKDQQEAVSKQVIRKHCENSGHHILWEVATREDYVPTTAFCTDSTTEGGAWILVHTFLSESYFPSLSELQTNGHLGLLIALVQWKTSITSKGM
jgi:hypothetical protein